MTPYQVRSSELSGELDMPFRTHNFTGQSAYLAHLRDLDEMQLQPLIRGIQIWRKRHDADLG